MNKKQFIFSAIVMIIIHYVAFYTGLRVEDWWGPIPKNPINDTIAFVSITFCGALDLLALIWGAISFYEFLED